MNPAWLKRAALFGLALMLATLWAWLTWLAPYRFGLWIALALTVPVLPALPGLIQGRRYSYKLCSLFSTFYMGFALVEAYSVAEARILALITLSAATLWFVASMLYSSATAKA